MLLSPFSSLVSHSLFPPSLWSVSLFLSFSFSFSFALAFSFSLSLSLCLSASILARAQSVPRVSSSPEQIATAQQSSLHKLHQLAGSGSRAFSCSDGNGGSSICILPAVLAATSSLLPASLHKLACAIRVRRGRVVCQCACNLNGGSPSPVCVCNQLASARSHLTRSTHASIQMVSEQSDDGKLLRFCRCRRQYRFRFRFSFRSR